MRTEDQRLLNPIQQNKKYLSTKRQMWTKLTVEERNGLEDFRIKGRNWLY